MDVRRTVIPLATALVAVLGACGGDGGDDATSSPVADLMGWNQTPAESRREQLAIEEAIARCMRDEGWEYTPVDWSAQLPDATDEYDPSDPEAYGRAHGYGIVDSYEQWEAPYLGADGDVGGPTFEDPNGDYMTSLAPNEQQAYQEALYGVPTDAVASVDDDGGEEYVSPPLEEQGCQGRAQLEVYGDDPRRDPEIQSDLWDRLDDAQDDPRLDAAAEVWRDCMADALAPLDLPPEMEPADPSAMYQIVDGLKNEATGLEFVVLDEQGEPLDGSSSADVRYSYDDQDGDGVAIGWAGEPEPIPDAALERLRTTELALWAVDWDCQEDAGTRDVQREVEQEVIDDLVAEHPELAEVADADADGAGG